MKLKTKKPLKSAKICHSLNSLMAYHKIHHYTHYIHYINKTYYYYSIIQLYTNIILLSKCSECVVICSESTKDLVVRLKSHYIVVRIIILNLLKIRNVVSVVGVSLI